MKTRFTLTVAITVLLSVTGSISGYAEERSATKEIAKALHQYYGAMASRDVQALRDVLESTFIVVEAGGDRAKTHVISAADTAKLLPPEGNDDWQNLQVTDLKVSVASTHPSVAIVSYSVFHPLSARHLEALEEVLKDTPAPLEEAQRLKVSKLLDDKGSKQSECAMLALRDGRWRIVSISVPR